VKNIVLISPQTPSPFPLETNFNIFNILITISGRIIGKGCADVAVWEEDGNNHNDAVRR
jgi:hypothetical protein